MCYGYRTGNGDFVQHKQRDIFSMKFSSSGIAAQGSADLTALRRNSFYETHGWWMWTAWMPIGFLLLCTKRYGKSKWSCMHLLHALLGYFCLIVTIVWAVRILDYFNWTVNSNIHSIVGVFATLLSVIVALSGTFTAGLMQFYENDKGWQAKEKVTSAGKFHRIAGYWMLFIGNATAMSGIQHYF